MGSGPDQLPDQCQRCRKRRAGTSRAPVADDDDRRTRARAAVARLAASRAAAARLHEELGEAGQQRAHSSASVAEVVRPRTRAAPGRMRSVRSSEVVATRRSPAPSASPASASAVAVSAPAAPGITDDRTQAHQHPPVAHLDLHARARPARQRVARRRARVESLQQRRRPRARGVAGELPARARREQLEGDHHDADRERQHSEQLERGLPRLIAAPRASWRLPHELRLRTDAAEPQAADDARHADRDAHDPAGAGRAPARRRAARAAARGAPRRPHPRRSPTPAPRCGQQHPTSRRPARRRRSASRPGR